MLRGIPITGQHKVLIETIQDASHHLDARLVKMFIGLGDSI